MAEFPALPSPSEGVASLDIETFLEALDGPPQQGQTDLTENRPRLLTIDVRSPAEFEEGHIPGAVNIPLFDNESRAVVGTDFKRKGRYEAIRKGLQLAGPNFASFLDTLQEHGAKHGSRLLVYCWRGGMRSGSMAWLFSLSGYEVQTLQGGYRSYRRWCKKMVGPDAIPPAPVMVLGGCTGVGKTAILHELRARGKQILDLEGLAKHRGSAFGATGKTQPSNEAFENILAFAVRRVRPNCCLWIEHEAKHVGKALVPSGIASWVSDATLGAMVVISMPKDLRVRRLVQDYCSDASEETRDQLKQCISGGLAKRLGGQRVKDALRLLDESRWDEVASMMLDYYDTLYKKWASQSRSSKRIEVDCPTLDAAGNADLVVQAVQPLELDLGIQTLSEPVATSEATAEAAAVVTAEVTAEGNCQ
ncbi:tRNA 2-selenouridine synthase, partial [Durusdinium trenchii]